MSAPYNLDEVQEYFEFILKGHTYHFRYLTAEEIEKMQSMSADNTKLNEYLFTFISPVNDAPKFIEISKQITSPQLKKFMEMLKSEFTVE